MNYTQNTGIHQKIKWKKKLAYLFYVDVEHIGTSTYKRRFVPSLNVSDFYSYIFFFFFFFRILASLDQQQL